MGQVIPIDMSKHGVVRKKITLNELQLDFRKKVSINFKFIIRPSLNIIPY